MDISIHTLHLYRGKLDLKVVDSKCTLQFLLIYLNFCNLLEYNLEGTHNEIMSKALKAFYVQVI